MKVSSFNLSNLRQRDIALLVVIVTVVAAGLWGFYVYKPALERIEILEQEIVNLDMQIAEGEAARNNLPELRKAVAEAEQDRLAFLEQLPREREVAALIDSLRTSAETADVTFQSISESGSQGEDIQGVRPLGFSLSTTGTYSETVGFLSSLETMQRFTKIGQVSLSVQDDESTNPDLSANYAFTVYVFMGEDPGAQQ